jgi:hypothetical protein
MGIKNPVFAKNSFVNADIIKCLVSSDQPCEAPKYSNSFTIDIANSLPLNIAISVLPGNIICGGTLVIFNIVGENGGNRATYQWTIN